MRHRSAIGHAPEPGQGDSSHVTQARPGDPKVLIEFRDVGLIYPGPPPVTAFTGCDLVISRGEYVSIIGPSGSGKSSFLNVAGLLDRPTHGTYTFEGVDVAELSDSQRTSLRGRRIGFVFQSFHLLPYRTAVENVVLAKVYTGSSERREWRRQARIALERVGLGHRADAQPTMLSGGERQRVAIARALISEPSVLLCDEPTGNLDTATTDSLLELFDGLHKDGVTILAITHNPEVADRAQYSLTMRDGQLMRVQP